MHEWDPVARRVTVVHPVPVGPTGPSRGQAAGPRWRRSSAGLYVPASVDGSVVEQRIVEQGARLPAGGAVTGWAGCRLHRVGLLDGLLPDGKTEMPVPLVMPASSRIRPDAGVRVLARALPPWEIVRLYGVPTARLARCAFDAIRLADDEREAIVVAEMVLATRLISPERLRAFARGHRREHGATRVLSVLDQSSEWSRSPNETRLRLIWERDAHLPPGLEVNRTVLGERGQVLGIADLLDVEAGLVVEFDGRDHRKGARHRKDVRKQEALLNHGLEVCRLTFVSDPWSSTASATPDRGRSRRGGDRPGASVSASPRSRRS